MIMNNRILGWGRGFLSYSFGKSKKSHTLKMKIKEM